jgi:cyclopropane fatty-acyl-phospholipid synthase-like methyltransferase
MHILEAMWGRGHVLPGGNEMIDLLTLPLGTNKEISALDLSAGMGAIGRRLASTLQTYVTGFEPDAEVAAYGQTRLAEENLTRYATVEPYDPATYEVGKRYDCILARELFYRVHDKAKFFQLIRESLKEDPKPYAQMVFTDYLLEAKESINPAVVSWLAHEPEARPIGLLEMTKLWKKHYFDIRVKEDLTELYIHDIKTALVNFVLFLKEQRQLTPQAKSVIAQEIERWAYREAAFENGLKFYRFYAIR